MKGSALKKNHLKPVLLLLLALSIFLFMYCSSEEAAEMTKGNKGVTFLSMTFDEALEMAAQQNKIIMIDVYSDG
jgi:hypothetical protein